MEVDLAIQELEAAYDNESCHLLALQQDARQEQDQVDAQRQAEQYRSWEGWALASEMGRATRTRPVPLEVRRAKVHRNNSTNSRNVTKVTFERRPVKTRTTRRPLVMPSDPTEMWDL